MEFLSGNEKAKTSLHLLDKREESVLELPKTLPKGGGLGVSENLSEAVEN